MAEVLTIELKSGPVADPSGPPRPAPGATGSPFDPTSLAREQMERERLRMEQARAVNLERQKIDPAFRAQQQRAAQAEIDRANAADDRDRDFAARKAQQDKLAAEKAQLEKNMLDPLFRARRQMEEEERRKKEARENEMARRQVDREYRLRREKEEELDRRRKELERARLDPIYRVREQMEKERTDKKTREEEDQIRRKLDPVYAARRSKDDRQAAMAQAAEAQQPYAAASRGIRAVVGTAGQATAQAISGDGAGSVQSVARAMSAIPGPVGVFATAIDAATGAVRGLVDGISATADRLAPYSGPISVAKANAETMQILRDIERADRLGSEMSEFIAAKSELSQTWQDMIASLMKDLAPMLTTVMEELSAFLKWFQTDFMGTINKAGDAAKDTVQGLLDGVFGKGFSELLFKSMKKIEEKIEPEDGEVQKDMLDVLLAIKRANGPIMGVADADGVLNLPAFGGGF